MSIEETTYSMKVFTSSFTKSPMPFMIRDTSLRQRQPARLRAAYVVGNWKISRMTSFKEAKSVGFNSSQISVMD